MKYAFYDFAVSPFSYDFVSFLVCAQSAGAEKVVFVPGERPYQKCTPEEQAYRLEHILRPLCGQHIVCKTRDEARALWADDTEHFPHNYTVDKPVHSHMLSHVMRAEKIHIMREDAAKLAEVKAQYPENTVTITMRKSHIRPARNSNRAAWMEAADWLTKNGYFPVFIPDTDDVTDYGEYAVCDKAAFDVQYRLALYTYAKQNLCVANGPPMLCFLSRRPMLMFKPITDGHWEVSADYWEKQGIPVGSQPPWFTKHQRIIWKDDTAEAIIAAMKQWKSVCDGTGQWEQPLVPKYPIYGVGSNDDRHKQMDEALKHGFPELSRKTTFIDRRISIVCYGPSLKKTWRQIKRPIMTISGAHDFLISKGIVPDFHMDCDPREHKVKMLKKPHKDVRYIMASCCHPSLWEKLKGYNVTLWHLLNGQATEDWMKQNHPEVNVKNMIGGGSTAGMRALEVCGAMGFRKFNVFGMDCSFDAEGHHAGEHLGKVQTEIRVTVGKNGREFLTSPQMKEAAQEIEKFVMTYDVELTMYGDGLAQEMIKKVRQDALANLNRFNVKKVA